MASIAYVSTTYSGRIALRLDLANISASSINPQMVIRDFNTIIGAREKGGIY